MADVSYKGVSNKEPKVSVSGIPQSQYNQSSGVSPPGQGGGIAGNIKQHWPVYTVVLAIITIIVIIWVNNNNNSAANTALTGTGSATSGTYPDQVYGSQLDADYQQMMSLQNQTNSLLQNLVNGNTNSGGGTTTGTQPIPNASKLPGGQPNPAWNIPGNGALYVANSGPQNRTILQLASLFKMSPAGVYNYGNNANVFAYEGIHSGQWNTPVGKNTVIAS
jgi:hypothetical protein